MAAIHRTTLVPSKPQLLAAWLPTRDWARSVVPASVEQLGSFRLDDPDGRVGIESLLLRTPEGSVLHVPVTYRDAPLAGAEAHLIGTAMHGVLGLRWVYDASHDPVYVSAALATILRGGTEATEEVQSDDGLQLRAPSVRAQGSGSASDSESPKPAGTVDDVRTEGGRTIVSSGGIELVVVRQPLTDALTDADEILTGTWDDRSAVLAGVRLRPRLPSWYADLSSALDTKMGLEVLELTPERVVGRMPVAGNTQPMGLWHGGASCVLAETLASIGSVAHGVPDQVAVGVDLNATHHRSVRAGWVTGTATALKLGRTVAMYEVVLVDDAGRRVCTARVTCQMVAATAPDRSR